MISLKREDVIESLEGGNVFARLDVCFGEQDMGGDIVWQGAQGDLVRLRGLDKVAIVLIVSMPPLYHGRRNGQELTISVDPSAFQAHPFFGANLALPPIVSPPCTPSTPPSPSITLVAIARTSAHSSSFA